MNLSDFADNGRCFTYKSFLAMNNQQLLECIEPHLPYRPKCQYVRSDDNEIITVDLTISDFNFLIRRNNAKLVLHPLSDLTKPCLQGGKVPIEELKVKFSVIEGSYLDEELKNLEYNANWNDFEEISFIPFIFIQQLIKWHFDIHGLIEKGYAIDINTLKQE